MLLGDKIKKLISTSIYKNPSKFHKALVSEFGDSALTYLTLNRTINNKTHIRERHLYQIGSLLNIDNLNLRKGTDSELEIDKNTYEGLYQYNKGAIKKTIKNDKNAPYSTYKIQLKTKSSTTIEQDAKSKGNYSKFVCGLYGRPILHIGNSDSKQSIVLDDHSCHYFDSTLPHYFENTSKIKTAVVLVIHSKLNN